MTKDKVYVVMLGDSRVRMHHMNGYHFCVVQVRSDVRTSMPAGGHQGYAALGGLYTQCRPLVPHLYGSVDDQEKYSPVSISLCTILLEVLHPHVDIGVHSSKLLLLRDMHLMIY